MNKRAACDTLHYDALVTDANDYDPESLAYWLGTCDIDAAGSIADWTALGFASSMACQFDIEDQAGRIGYVFQEDAEWLSFFRPIAPIQLTKRWSPVPRGHELLGPPILLMHEADQFGVVAVVAGWSAVMISDCGRIGRAKERDPVIVRFSGLLSVAVLRAREPFGGVLLVAKPGWRFDGEPDVDARTKAAWRKVGFAVTDRRPNPPKRR